MGIHYGTRPIDQHAWGPPPAAPGVTVSSFCADCWSRQPLLKIPVADFGRGNVVHELVEQPDTRCEECPTRALDPVNTTTTTDRPSGRRRWFRWRRTRNAYTQDT
jgi:hypothetical protein